MRLLFTFLKKIFGPEHYGLIGDINEMYENIKEERGSLKAVLWFIRQLPPTLILFIKERAGWTYSMFGSYLRIAVRNMKKNHLYSFVNITGLAIGMACSILISLWVADELSYDKHAANSNIYRLVMNYSNKRTANTPDSMALYLKERIPEITGYTQIKKSATLTVKYTPHKEDPKVFYENRLFHVDRNFFKYMKLKFLKGGIDKDFNGLVISEKIAEKYFGDANPIGKTLNTNWGDIRVIGVVENIPRNSHLTPEIYTNRKHLKRAWPGGFNWGNHTHELYFKVSNNSNIEAVEAGIIKLLWDRGVNKYKEYLKSVSLQRMDKIYLHSYNVRSDFSRSGDINYVYIFSIIAVFILFIACLNFINLITARSENRIREVAVRKVAGAGMKTLIPQFIGESTLFAAVSALIAAAVIYFALPSFTALVDKNLGIDLLSPDTIAAFVLIVLFTGILAGIYPAVYISSQKTVSILKGKRRNSSGFFNFRNILVIIQFSFSAFLFITTLAINSQMDFMQSKKLGFNKDRVLCVPMKSNFGKQFKSVKNRLLKNPDIASVSFKDCYPTRNINNSDYDWEGRGGNNKIHAEETTVGYDYINLMKINIVEGRGFSEKFRADSDKSIVINRSMADIMGKGSSIGKWISLGKNRYTIVGVMENAHFKSLHKKIKPLILKVSELTDQYATRMYGIALIRMSGNSPKKLVKYVHELWKDVNGHLPFEYNFMDDVYNRLYSKESRTGSILELFSLLAIIISALGVFALASFAAEQRTREIGVRKVLGASSRKIVTLLSKDFLKLVLISNVIAWPVGYYAMQKWLDNFEYRVEPGIEILLISGLSALIIAQLSVSYQSFRAASADPVNSLKHE